ncbi:hypothetical protein B0T16DRAFT_394537 [Cercophora newfieldiana]|uniref:Zn(2)-C6 fungal-type domain-containing protein n=1 Tax=Cercophora newfieldiana TaxID=92897 RepID=A0AA39XR31_9PEZI|nr:hypothetical protein B0T16DRAFT_394537 [Cercophora newfieldiana]
MADAADEPPMMFVPAGPDAADEPPMMFVPAGPDAADEPPMMFGPAGPAAPNGSVDANPNGTPDPNVKTVKRRASKACLNCRQRKVRCDVTGRPPGTGCNNCNLDHVPCTVEPCRRRKKIMVRFGHASGAQHGLPAVQLAAHQQYPLGFQPQAPQDVSGLQYEAPAQHAMMAPNGQPQFRFFPRAHSLPRYIRPLPAESFGAEDLDYIANKGTFLLPSPKLLSAILTKYAEVVHPALPVLDLDEVLSTINQPEGQLAGPQLSLFAFHAMMFAAIGFVELDVLNEAGFRDGASARRTFYSKAVTLFGLDAERDRLAAIQGMLLLTFFYQGNDGSSKDPWYWLAVANSGAEFIALNEDPKLMTNDPARQKLRKRLWWCLCMRDRMVAMGMRRQGRVQAFYHKVPLLEISDFDIKPLSEQSLAILSPNCVWARDINFQLQTSEMFIEHTKLLPVIDAILKTQYYRALDLNPAPTGGDPEVLYLLHVGRHSMLKAKANTDSNQETVDEIEKVLTKWHGDLPASCQLQPITIENGNDVLGLHRHYLHAAFLATKSLLLRPELEKVGNVKATAATKLRGVASDILQLFRELDQHGLARRLLTTGVTVLMPSLLIHLLRMKEPVSSDERQQALEDFEEGFGYMKELGQMYPAAKNAVHFLETTLHRITGITAADLAAVSKRKNTPPVPEMNLRGIEDTPPPDQDQPRFGNAAPFELPLRTAQHAPGMGPAGAEASPPLSPVGGFGAQLNSSPAQQPMSDFDGMILSPAPQPILGFNGVMSSPAPQAMPQYGFQQPMQGLQQPPAQPLVFPNQDLAESFPSGLPSLPLEWPNDSNYNLDDSNDDQLMSQYLVDDYEDVEVKDGSGSGLPEEAWAM